jgi:hypothetical protein
VISRDIGDDDQYSNGKLAKYKKMIEDSKKPLYHVCVAQYTRLFRMVKVFQLKPSNRWIDCNFIDLLTLLKDMLPQGNAVPVGTHKTSISCTNMFTKCIK